MPRSLLRLHSKSHLFISDEISQILKPTSPTAAAFSSVKVVFTIGPACQDVESLCKILNAGATIARVDVSWGDVKYHEKSLQHLQLAMKKTKRMCAVMMDTCGREITVKRPFEKNPDGWWLHSESYEVDVGQEITFTSRDVPASANVLPLAYDGLPGMCYAGDIIYVSRYLQTGAESSCYLQVKEVTETDVVCEVQSKAVLAGLLTIWHIERNPYGPIDNKQNSLPILTKRDKEAITELSSKFDIDFISLSHTREAEDIDEARAFLKSVNSGFTKIIAKIETKYALTRFKDILNNADGVMISRANLGLDVPSEKIALIQKNMVSWCNILGKPCIVTRVCDTMISAPRPTRAEATDCANIILDGADGYVLGAETLRGKFPVETVTTVLHIGRMAEQQFDHARHYDYLMDEAMMSQQQAIQASLSRSTSDMSLGKKTMTPAPSYTEFANAVNAIATVASQEERDDSIQTLQSLRPAVSGIPYLSKVESIASSAVRTAERIAAQLLVVFTHSGNTAQLVSKYRPRMPILTLVVPKIRSNSLSWKLEGREVARQCLLVRGLLPILATPRASAVDTLKEAIVAAQLRGLVNPGDRVVIIQRIHEDFAMKIIAVDDLLTPASESSPKKPVMLKTLSEVID